MGCVFCEIIQGRRPAHFVYRGERVVAFLDRYPLYRGHTLVVPVQHYRDITDTPDDVLAEMISLSKRIAIALMKALDAPGVRILANNGAAAGQVIFHVHIHVIPYGVEKTWRRPLEPEEGEKLARMIRDALPGN